MILEDGKDQDGRTREKAFEGEIRRLIKEVSLKFYPAYKPSGIEWFDHVPTHRKVRCLRDAADMRVGNVDRRIREDEKQVHLYDRDELR